jgi:hypothetical protein
MSQLKEGRNGPALRQLRNVGEKAIADAEKVIAFA